MLKEDKDLFKLLNLIAILVCWFINYILMFIYPPITILLAEIFVFIIINLILFIITMVLGDD